MRLHTLASSLLAAAATVANATAQGADGELYTGFSADGRATAPAELDPGSEAVADRFDGAVSAGRDLVLLGRAGTTLRLVVMDARTGVTQSVLRFPGTVASASIDGPVVGPVRDAAGRIYFATTTSTNLPTGDADFWVCRVTHDTNARTLALDTGYGSGGCGSAAFDLGAPVDRARDYAFAIAHLDGKLWVGGAAEMADGAFAPALAAFTPTGALDPTFSGDGRETYAASTPDGGSIYRIAPARNGRLLLGLSERASAATDDYDAGVLRVLRAGGVDVAWADQGYRRLSIDVVGKQLREEAVGVFENPSGQVVGVFGALGTTERNTVQFRLTPSGALDASFNGDGYYAYVNFGLPVGAERQPDGRLVGTVRRAEPSDTVAFRFETDGERSCPYGNDAQLCRLTDRAGQPAARANGLILVANRPLLFGSVGTDGTTGQDAAAWMLDEGKVFESGFE